MISHKYSDVTAAIVQQGSLLVIHSLEMHENLECAATQILKGQTK